MRRMKRDDEGAVLVSATIGLTALLLMAAFALDIGQLFAHKARAQNSADATALAAAINCAQGRPSNSAPLPPLKAGQSPELETCGQTEPNTVQAAVSEPVDFQFAPIDPVTVRRPAKARWDGTVVSPTCCRSPSLSVNGRRPCSMGPRTSRSIWTTRRSRTGVHRFQAGSASFNLVTRHEHRDRCQWRRAG